MKRVKDIGKQRRGLRCNSLALFDFHRLTNVKWGVGDDQANERRVFLSQQERVHEQAVICRAHRWPKGLPAAR